MMSRRTNRFRWSILLCALCIVAGVARASRGQQQQPATETPPSAAEREAAAERLLSHVEGLENATVELDEGTAIIDGVADDPAVINLAESITRSSTGATTVRNDIRLTSDVTRRIRGAANRVGDRVDQWLAFVPLIPIALLVVALCAVTAWLVGKWDWPFRRLSSNPFLGAVIKRLSQVAIVIAGVLLGLEILNATALVGGVLGAAGIAGIAIGFAFRDLVENYIAGILLSLRQPFRPNDIVRINEHEGLITSMNSRTTVLTTYDGNVVEIPNSMVFKTPLVNYSTDPRRRFMFSIGLGMDVYLAGAVAIGVETLRRTQGVMADPEPFGIITALGDSRITLQLFGWVDQRASDLGKVSSSCMQRVKAEFESRQISMPEPAYIVRLARQAQERGRDRSAAPSTNGHWVEAPTHDVARDDTVEELAAATAREQGGENLLSGARRS